MRIVTHDKLPEVNELARNLRIAYIDYFDSMLQVCFYSMICTVNSFNPILTFSLGNIEVARTCVLRAQHCAEWRKREDGDRGGDGVVPTGLEEILEEMKFLGDRALSLYSSSGEEEQEDEE